MEKLSWIMALALFGSICSCVENHADIDSVASDGATEFDVWGYNLLVSEEDDNEVCDGCITGDEALNACQATCRDGHCEEFYSVLEAVVGHVAARAGIECPSLCNELRAFMPPIYRFDYDPFGGVCKFRRTAFRISDVRLVSGIPATKQGDGSYMRSCIDGTARRTDALLLSVSLIGSGRPAVFTSYLDDVDISVRPGDLISTLMGSHAVVKIFPDFDGQYTFSPDLFDVSIDCLEPFPAAHNIATPCSLVQTIRGAPDSLTWSNNHSDGSLRPPADEPANAVAILIDQSGSMIGKVDSYDNTELTVADFSTFPDYESRSTDFQGYRLDAALEILDSLNVGDRAGIFVFGEGTRLGGAKILCNAGSVGELESRAGCFGTDRSIAHSIDAAAFRSAPSGRSNLWDSVQDVYDFLKSDNISTVKQIVVVTDGPDTCAEGSGLPCSDVTWDAFRANVLKDVLDDQGNPKAADRIPVHVSVVQMQSRGYPDIDPAQQEIACLTGGHYRFINSNDLPVTHDIAGLNLDLWGGEHPLSVALRHAMFDFRFALSGVWQIAVGVEDISNGLLVGDIVSFSGEIAANGSISDEAAPLDARAVSKAEFHVLDTIDFRGTFHLPVYDSASSSE